MWSTINKVRGHCFGVLLDDSQERNLREMDIRKSARGTDISNLSLYYKRGKLGGSKDQFLLYQMNCLAQATELGVVVIRPMQCAPVNDGSPA